MAQPRFVKLNFPPLSRQKPATAVSQMSSQGNDLSGNNTRIGTAAALLTSTRIIRRGRFATGGSEVTCNQPTMVSGPEAPPSAGQIGRPRQGSEGTIVGDCQEFESRLCLHLVHRSRQGSDVVVWSCGSSTSTHLELSGVTALDV